MCLLIQAIAQDGRGRGTSILDSIRRGDSGPFYVNDSETAMSVTSRLAREFLRASHSRKAILVLVADWETAQQYRDYFQIAYPSAIVQESLRVLSSTALNSDNVTLTTHRALRRALREGAVNLTQIGLIVVDDESDTVNLDVVTVPASRSLPKVIAFTRSRRTTTSTTRRPYERLGVGVNNAGTSPTTAAHQFMGLDDASRGLVFPEQLVIRALSSYAFRNRELLVRAFLHPTKAAQLKSNVSYEPLDYVGDFALRFIVSRCIMKNGTVTEKSQMHAITTEILRQETCAFLAAKNGFDSYVFLDDGPEKQYLTEYATAVRAQGIHSWRSLQKQKCFLHNFFKSVAGAVYVDSGYDPVVLERIYLPLLQPSLGSNC